MLEQRIVDDIDDIKNILQTSETDVSDIDGTVNVEQGLIQLEIEIGRTYQSRHGLVKVVEDGWYAYKNRQGSFCSVVDEAVRIIPEVFQGLPREDVARLAEFVISRDVAKMYTFPKALFQKLRTAESGARGRRILLAITGSPHDLAFPLCKLLGFDVVIGSNYYFDANNRYTGERDARPARDKGSVMDELSDRCSLSWSSGIALGDSPTDIPMFERCAYRLAVNPTVALQQWMRKHPELNVVWVNDHQKTGVQFMQPDNFGRYREKMLIDILPHPLGMDFQRFEGGWTPF